VKIWRHPLRVLTVSGRRRGFSPQEGKNATCRTRRRARSRRRVHVARARVMLACELTSCRQESRARTPGSHRMAPTRGTDERRGRPHPSEHRGSAASPEHRRSLALTWPTTLNRECVRAERLLLRTPVAPEGKHASGQPQSESSHVEPGFRSLPTGPSDSRA
jgi:hypothetical protein